MIPSSRSRQLLNSISGRILNCVYKYLATTSNFCSFGKTQFFVVFCICYIARYGNVQNGHRMLVTYIHNVEHRNLGIRKHVMTSCSGTKPFYYFWVKGFDIRRETQSYYSVFIIWPLSRSAPMARKFVSPLQAPKVEPPRLASSFISSELSPNSPQILRALPVRDVTLTSSPVSSSQAIVTSLRDMSALCVHALPPASRLHLTNPKVLSLTKPKGMNRNPLAIILHIYLHLFMCVGHLVIYYGNNFVWSATLIIASLRCDPKFFVCVCVHGSGILKEVHVSLRIHSWRIHSLAFINPFIIMNPAV